MTKREGRSRGAIRADLEATLLDLVDHEQVTPVIRLRIQQAIARGGMDALLGPALADLDRADGDVAAAKARILETIHSRLGVRS